MENLIKHDGANSRFYIEGSQEDKGFLAYTIQDNVMTMSSTYVDPKYRGHQYARKLVEAGVAFAKEKQLRINPTCSYALKVVEKDYPNLMI